MEIRATADGNVLLGPEVMTWKKPDELDCSKCGARGHQWFALQYCRGSLPPGAKVRNGEGKELGEVEIPCGGVLEEHLHVHCRCCHHDRLMETKEGADKRVRRGFEAAKLRSADELTQLVPGGQIRAASADNN